MIHAERTAHFFCSESPVVPSRRNARGSVGSSVGKGAQGSSIFLIGTTKLREASATLVGENTVLQIPSDFTLQYKFAETLSTKIGAVKAFLDWTCEDGSIGFLSASAKPNFVVQNRYLGFERL